MDGWMDGIHEPPTEAGKDSFESDQEISTSWTGRSTYDRTGCVIFKL